jgi:hypothetical protein
MAADSRLGFHATGRRDDNIRDRSHERAQEVHLRALPDACGARLGQNNPQRDRASEPALAASCPHDGCDQHHQDEEDEGAGHLVHVPEFEALFHHQR